MEAKLRMSNRNQNEDDIRPRSGRTLPDPVDMRVEVKIQDLVNDLDEAISKAGGKKRRSLRA